MPSLLRVFKNAKKRDQSQVTKSLTDATTITTATEYWTVIYDGVVDQLTAGTATGLPVPGNVYSGLICTGVRPTRTNESPYVWEVQVDYQFQTYPTGIWNIALSVDDSTIEQTAFEDRINLPLCNVNNDILPNLPQETIYHSEISINYQTDDISGWDTIQAAKGLCNSDTVDVTINGFTVSYAPRQMKLTGSPIRCNKIKNGSGYILNYDITLKFLCKNGDDTFVWRSPNIGYNAYNESDELVVVTDPKTGVPLTTPSRLDGEGRVIDPDAAMVWLPDAFDGGSPPAGRFEIEDQTDFTPLLSPLAD